jgi:hypothetical protein
MIPNIFLEVKWSKLKVDETIDDTTRLYKILSINQNIFFSELIFRDLETQQVFKITKQLFGLISKIVEVNE